MMSVGIAARVSLILHIHLRLTHVINGVKLSLIFEHKDLILQVTW